MQHHAREGFQRTVLNDVYHVEEQLQEYDPELYIMWNPKTGEHLVMDGMVGMAVMRIPQIGFPVLTSAVVDHMKKIHTETGFSASAQIDAADAARERELLRRQEDLAQDFAKEAREAGINAYDYGKTSGHKKYVQVTK